MTIQENSYLPITIALAAPIVDITYGLIDRAFWKMRLRSYNIHKWDNYLLSQILERCIKIDSHYRFLGWWVMSFLGTGLYAKEKTFFFSVVIIALLLIFPVWLFYLTLGFDEITGIKKKIPVMLKIIGYLISFFVAILSK